MFINMTKPVIDNVVYEKIAITGNSACVYKSLSSACVKMKISTKNLLQTSFKYLRAFQ